MSDSVPEVLQQTDRRKATAMLLLLGGFAVGVVATVGFLGLIGAFGSGDGGTVLDSSMGGMDSTAAAASRLPSSGTTKMTSPSATAAATASSSASMSDMPSPTSSGAPSDQPSGTISLADALAMHIPTDIRPACHGQDLEGAQHSAYYSVVCEPGDPVDRVQYSSFHDAESLRDRFDKDATASGIDPGSASECSAQTVSGCVSSYWMAASEMLPKKPLTHHIGTDADRGATHGRLLAYQTEDQQVVEWYDYDTHIYAWAFSPVDSAAELFTWWQRYAGPAHPRMTEMAGT